MTWQRWATWIGVLLGLAALSAVLVASTARSGVPLDPQNPGDEGTQALAQVLQDEGVDVQVVRGSSALAGTDLRGATLLIQGTDRLAQGSGQAVMAQARQAARVVVLEPGPTVGDVLDLPVTAAPFAPTTRVGAECDSATWRAGDLITGAGTLVEVIDDSPAQICYPPSAGFTLGGTRGGHVVELPATAGSPPVLLLGVGGALVNETIDQDANAAAGLRLLGSTERLIWLVPTLADLGDGPARSLTDVLPDAAVPVAALLGAGVVVLALVRGRRLGPLVSEPLPVLVRSVETTQSRARLYQAATDRHRTLAVLQAGARRRLAVRLGLPPSTDDPTLVQAVSHATGRSVEQVRALLTDPGAVDDETLVRTAREVRSLEEGAPPR